MLKPDPHLPRLDRISFHLSREEGLVAAVGETLERHASDPDAPPLTPDQNAILTWSRLVADVLNGGFAQFFYNHNRGHDAGVVPLADRLDGLGLPKIGPLLRDAEAVYRRHEARFQVANPFDGLFGSIKEFDKLDSAFARQMGRADKALEKWARENLASLVVGDDGRPIDPTFTGTVEVLHPNGLVAESLEVKKGKPHGAHRQFHDDGTLKRVAFFRSGEVTGDFWPDGTLKRKESKAGDRTVIEWFHPDGTLQKRLAQAKNGQAVEPIRLYHPNGALAEELSVRDGKPFGPWLRFFDDGSPRLVAEHDETGRPIVLQAWDDDRRQVVRDGAGLFHHDARSLNVGHKVVFVPDFTDDRELEGGVPHGTVTTYFHGVLWSRAEFRQGTQHGQTTTYWPNGRVRSISEHEEGKERKAEKFPRFDRPVPAVILQVQADATLYGPWNHPTVDTYPTPQNLGAIQSELPVPAMLREVEDRNRAGTLKSSYESWDTFDDSITYFLTVGPDGVVTTVSASGSGTYSGGLWDVYVPFLKRLASTQARSVAARSNAASSPW
jgi:antitoxin component YwqK of YwqJK toxin-antitoxin module